VAALGVGRAGDVAFVGTRKAAAAAQTSAAGCLIVRRNGLSRLPTVIRAAEPRTALCPRDEPLLSTVELKPGVHPTAWSVRVSRWAPWC